jgi:hypothetical protein
MILSVLAVIKHNLLHHGEHFCSSMWCKELADLYENTLEMCNLTKINNRICKGSNEGLTPQIISEELICSMTDMSKLALAMIKGKPYIPPEIDDCGCHEAEGSKFEMLDLILRFSTLKIAMETLHNKQFPDNFVTSLGVKKEDIDLSDVGNLDVDNG